MVTGSLAGWLVVASAVLEAGAGTSAGICIDSAWDRGLPSLKLTDVSVSGTGLAPSWQNLIKGCRVRVVLYVPRDEGQEQGVGSRPFQFAAEECTVKELLDSYCAHYGLAWEHEPRTGVIWALPRTIPQNSSLSLPVTVREDLHWTPVVSGLLHPLALMTRRPVKAEEKGPWEVFSLGMSAYNWPNTYDYVVSVPKGTHTLREVISMCCLTDPTKTFAVFEGKGGFLGDLVMPVTYAPSTRMVVPLPAPLSFWRTEIGPFDGDAPSMELIREKLASPDPRVRWASRFYTRATSNVWRLERAVHRQGGNTDEAMWVVLGLLDVTVRRGLAEVPEYGPWAAKEITTAFKAFATEETLLTGNAQLALLVSLELARTSFEPDTSALRVLSKRRFERGELAGIEYDAGRIAAYSSIAREALTDRACSYYIDTSGWAEGFIPRKAPDERFRDVVHVENPWTE